MSAGQRAAMEVAEAAREDAESGDSFAADLFDGRFHRALLEPFSEQSPEDRVIGDEMVEAVADLLRRKLDADEVDETRTIPADVIAALRELGVFRIKVPEKYGGLGFSQINYNRVIQAIASHCGSTAVLVSAHQSIGVPQPLLMCGTNSQKEKFLPRIAAGELSAFALTECGVGSDPARMETTATLSEDGEHWIINGEKLWASNGPIADLLVVMAQTPPKVYRGREKRQITAFIVEASSPGVEVVHRCDFMGLRAIQNGVIRFTSVKVPKDNLLWGEGLGLKLALRTLNTGRLTLPAACAGMAKQCLAIARQWGAEREQWGTAIGRHEAGAQKIADIAATTFAIEAVSRLTSSWADTRRPLRIEAAMAKLFASEAAWRIVDETMQLRAGRGYERAASLRARGEKPYPVERMMRDCRINLIIEGTSDIMRLFLAREALDPHLKRAADLLRRGTPFGRKMRLAGRLALFYARWYPARLLGGRSPWRHRDAGRLATHYRFVERASNRLAASLLVAMLRHGPKLEKRQILLGRLMDIGTELFAMSAACAYARSDSANAHHDGSPELLADAFCRASRRRIEELFGQLRSRDDRQVSSLADKVLEGDFQWLEQGVIVMADDKEPQAAPAPPAASTGAGRKSAADSTAKRKRARTVEHRRGGARRASDVS